MSTGDTEHHPRRVLSSGFTLAVVIGGTIGLGILRTPGEIATVVTDPLMFVSLWVLGGLFALLSAFVLAGVPVPCALPIELTRDDLVVI